MPCGEILLEEGHGCRWRTPYRAGWIPEAFSADASRSFERPLFAARLPLIRCYQPLCQALAYPFSMMIRRHLAVWSEWCWRMVRELSSARIKGLGRQLVTKGDDGLNRCLPRLGRRPLVISE